MQELLMKIRENQSEEWVANFAAGGWKIRNDANSGWIQLTTTNTKVRNATDSGWLQPK